MHVHHWIIEEKGKELVGTCRKRGCPLKVRTFPRAQELDMGWRDMRLASARSLLPRLVANREGDYE